MLRQKVSIVRKTKKTQLNQNYKSTGETNREKNQNESADSEWYTYISLTFY